MKWMTMAVVLAMVGPLPTGRTWAQYEGEDEELAEVDNVALATQLFRDGFYDRAEAVLSTVDPNSETVDSQQYWRLRGLVASRLAKYAEAADYFRRGIRAGDREPKIYLLLAQAYGQSGQWENAALTLRLAPKKVKDNEGAYLLESTAFAKIDKKDEAYSTLQEGVSRFPGSTDLERQRIFLLVDMGLYQSAIEAARAFFEQEDVGLDDRIALAQALRNGGELDQAVLMLEEAMLEAPTNLEVRRELAAAYNQKGRTFTSAEILRPIAWLDPQWAQDAAELYNRAGNLEMAMLMNQRVEDQKVKVAQRMAILLKRERFEEAASLEDRMVRLGLIEDENLLYALAYAHFRVGAYTRSERLLQRFTDADLFRKAVALRESIEDCRQRDWRCE